MGKKLTEKELRKREVKKVVQKIRNLEKIHNQDVVKSACYKYNIAIQDKKRAEQDIREAEERLFDAKRRLKK
ncbi:MAG: hypothetical protein DRN27_06490 [Thermoplasmata archaeon]|nr:MAG: hypothetical protein DRN27_06490 [Thermoplasmata archaeon]